MKGQIVCLTDPRRDHRVIFERSDDTRRGREEIENARQKFYALKGYFPGVGIKRFPGDTDLGIAGRNVKQEGLDFSKRWQESQLEEQERRAWTRRIFAQV